MPMSSHSPAPGRHPAAPVYAGRSSSPPGRARAVVTATRRPHSQQTAPSGDKGRHPQGRSRARQMTHGRLPRGPQDQFGVAACPEVLPALLDLSPLPLPRRVSLRRLPGDASLLGGWLNHLVEDPPWIPCSLFLPFPLLFLALEFLSPKQKCVQESCDPL